MEDKHYAVLIDADNISSKYIAYILDEMTKYGVITYKRIYEGGCVAHSLYCRPVDSRECALLSGGVQSHPA